MERGSCWHSVPRVNAVDAGDREHFRILLKSWFKSASVHYLMKTLIIIIRPLSLNQRKSAFFSFGF